MQPLAPQIQEAVTQARLLGIIEIAEDGQRQFLGPALDGDFLDAELDLARRQVGVDGLGRAGDDRPGQGQDPFRTRVRSLRKYRAVRLDHALGDAVMVPQIDEKQPAMVAGAMDPAR